MVVIEDALQPVRNGYRTVGLRSGKSVRVEPKPMARFGYFLRSSDWGHGCCDSLGDQ